MVSPKPVMAAVDVFEAIGEPRRGQRVGPQPAARIGKPAHVHRGDTGHGAHSHQRAPPGQRGAPGGAVGFGAWLIRFVVLLVV